MFCNNLDVLYDNPIKNRTNLLHKKYNRCKWFDSYKYFNENILLKLCKYNKQIFLKKGFQYIGKKCCQFMINRRVCEKYGINPFNQEFNFYYSEKSNSQRNLFFSIDKSDEQIESFKNDIWLE